MMTAQWFFRRLLRSVRRSIGALLSVLLGIGALVALTQAAWSTGKHAQNLADAWLGEAQILVVLNDAVTWERTQLLANILGQLPGVAAALPISPDQARKRLEAESRAQAVGGTQAADAEPLFDPALLPPSIEVRLSKDPEASSVKLVAALNRWPDVASVDNFAEGAGRIMRWQVLLARSLFVVPCTLLLAMMLGLVLAVRSARRQQRNVAQTLALLGATPWQLRAPGVLLGAGLGLAGVSLGLGLAPPVAHWLSGRLGLPPVSAMPLLPLWMGTTAWLWGLGGGCLLGALCGALSVSVSSPRPRIVRVLTSFLLLMPTLTASIAQARPQRVREQVAPPISVADVLATMTERLAQREKIIVAQHHVATLRTRQQAHAAYRVVRSSQAAFFLDPQARTAKRAAVLAALRTLQRSSAEIRALEHELAVVRQDVNALPAPLPKADPMPPPRKTKAPRSAVAWPIVAAVVGESGEGEDLATGVRLRLAGTRLLGRAGESVRTPAAGRISHVQAGAAGAFTVAVDHGAALDNLVSVIGGLKTATVTAGQSVAAGASLGLLGRTLDGAPVLTVEFWRAGVAVDPRLLRPHRPRSQ